MPAGSESAASDFRRDFALMRAEIGKVIVGQQEVIDAVLTCLLADGHVLLEGVPGLGKTLLIRTLSRVLDLRFSRIQFTPDLMPADIVGTNLVVEDAAGQKYFEFQPGPIFANIILADEINRASPKTQSALLESMGEEQVTVDGTTHHLARPFMVIATQNPIEHQGTYPLPEAQLDRFLMRVSVGYPGRDDELSILSGDGGDPALHNLRPVVTSETIEAMGRHAAQIHVSVALSSYLVDLATVTRRHRQLSLGMSPRATLGLQQTARVRAAALGRSFVIPDDVRALLHPVVAHRLIVSPEAQIQGVTAVEVLDDVLRSVPVPVDAPVN